MSWEEDRIDELAAEVADLQHQLTNTQACLYARNLALAGADAQLEKVTQQRDTALAALGQVQAAAAELMAAADALLRERDNYRAACAAAAALGDKEGES